MDWLQLHKILFLFALVLAARTGAAEAPGPGPTTNGSAPTTASTTTAPKPHVQNTCTKEQTKYAYTECDIGGGRWRVQVPLKPNSCNIKNPEKPERGTACSFTCPEGQYLNIDTQKCQKCQPGTFSLSGGVRFRTWKDLPSGFSTWSENGDEDTGKTTKKKCAGKIWTTKGDYVESAGDYCKSVLAYSVTLKKDGNVSLVYRAADDMAFFHVKIVNDFCTTTKGGKHHFYLNPEMRWKRTYVPLKRGRNVIIIEAAYFYDSEDTSTGDAGDFDSGSTPASSGDGMEGRSDKKNRMKSVQIREIKISGLSYTSECTKCEAGTYSPAGAAGCLKCDENTFSHEGALSCTRCASDEYSAKGSGKCTKKPKCSEKDFYEMWSECDANGKTKKSNFWVMPKICDGGAPLPKSGAEKDCPPCNPGQFKNGSSCSFCDSDQFSDGKNGCKKCPPSTSPNLGYYFRWWQNIPKDTFHFYCVSKSDRSCKTDIGWRQFNTYMDTGIGHADDAEAGLIFHIPGFKDEKATIVLEYETHCTSLCTFILESTKELAGRSVILKQHGRQRKTKFTHHIDGKEAVTFRIRFMKSEGDPANSYDYPEDRLNLYAMNITHTLGGGGADHCTECPLGLGNQNGCVQCEAGSYLEKKICTKCPKGTYLDTKNPVGRSACLPCPKWTTSEEGATRCFSDCHLHSDAGHHFDFTPLAGTMHRKNSRSFTSHGYPFYRVFNITICGGPNAMSKCTNNFTKGSLDDEAKNKKLASVKSMVCRSTIIPSHEKKKNIVAQSMSLGDYLDAVVFGYPHKVEASKNASSVETSRKGRHRIRRDEHDVNDTQPLDVNFIFKSRQPTSRCSDGYSTIVTVRCDPMAAKRGHIRTHEDCSSGTCDGCLYHLFWHSTYACPLCTYSDYQNITSACVKGEVRTHYVWNYPKLCRDGVKLPASVSRGCSVFERTVLDLKVFLFVFLGMALTLVVLIVVLCYRNRRLKYKYSRLVDEAHGELPASEKCAYDDGEEEDEIILSRGPTSNGRRILDRIKSKIGSPKNRDEFAEFETINLTDRIRHNSSGDEI